MHWSDEGYLLSKNNFNENSIIIEAFTLNHGKYTGIVYGGSSRKQKKNFQIGNKILLNWISKGSNRSGYFNIELINPIAPFYFDDKKKSATLLSASTILKILLPEGQINKIVYNSFESMLNNLKNHDWIKFYIFWELKLIKELGYEINFLSFGKPESLKVDSVEINNKTFKIPKFLFNKDFNVENKKDVKEALNFNKSLLIENFFLPNKLNFPIFRNILEKYYS